MHLGAICRTPNEKTSAGSPYGRSDSTSGARYRAEPMQAVGRGDPSLSSRAVPKSQSLHLWRSMEIWNGDRWRFGWRSVEIWMEIGGVGMEIGMEIGGDLSRRRRLD